MLQSPAHVSGLLLIGAAPVAALQRAANTGAKNLQAGMTAREALPRALAAFASGAGARLSWQTNTGAQTAVSGARSAGLLRAAGIAAVDSQTENYFRHEIIAGVARDQHGELAAAAIAPLHGSQTVLPPAALAPGAGLCADDWGAAVVLGDDAVLWALSPARKLADAMTLNEPAGAGRELLLLARARRASLSFAMLSPAGEFIWGAPAGELPRAWAGDGDPPRQARAEKR